MRKPTGPSSTKAVAPIFPQTTLDKIIAAAGGPPESADGAGLLSALSDDLHAAQTGAALRDAMRTPAFDVRVKDLARIENLMRQIVGLFTVGGGAHLRRRHIEGAFVIEEVRDRSEVRSRGEVQGTPSVESDLGELLRIAQRFAEYAKRGDKHLRSLAQGPLDTAKHRRIETDTWLIAERLPDIYKRHWRTKFRAKSQSCIAFVQQCLLALGRSDKTADAIIQIIKRHRRGTRPETIGMKSPR
jgi:hypothetical protein